MRKVSSVKDKTSGNAPVSAQGKPPATQFAELLRQKMPDLRERYNISYLGLFGSYVRNEQRKGSDLDVLVEFSETPGLFKFIRLERELAELLGVKVDLIMKSALKPSIGERILREVSPV